MPEINPLWKKLKLDQPVLGAFCALGSADAAEIACRAGYDFVLIDWQHGPFSRDRVSEAVRAVQAMGGVPVGRTPGHGSFPIEWMLDMGFPALIAAMVNTPEQAQAVVRASHYPPIGIRSQAHCRAGVYYGEDYRRRFNDEFMLLVMIEHVDAVNNIRAIIATPGIAGCFVGPTDLASSMGLAKGAGVPAFEEAVSSVLEAVRAEGKIAGIATGTPVRARRRIDQGFRLVTLSTDRRLLAEAMAEARREVLEG